MKERKEKKREFRIPPGRNQKFCGYGIRRIVRWFKSLDPFLKKLRDSRDRRGLKYPIDYIFRLYLVSGLGGYSECSNAEVFLKEKRDLIGRFIPEVWNYGIPSHDCFCDALSLTDAEELRKMLKGFIAANTKPKESRPVLIRTKGVILKEEGVSEERELIIREHLCVDGKASRGATDRKNGKVTPYIGNFFDPKKRLFLDAIYISGGKRQGEGNLIREELRKKNLKGTIITADALHTSTATMKVIRDSGGEFLLRLKKGSHPARYRQITALIEAADLSGDSENCGEKTFIENRKGGIVKTRIRFLSDSGGLLRDYAPDIAEILLLESETYETLEDENGKTSKKVTSSYQCCFLCSCRLITDQLYELIREHWDIESAHWILDNYLEEDRSTGRTGNQVINRAIIRRILYDLLKMLELSLPETEEYPIRRKFIFLNEHIYCALMMITGYREDYPELMAQAFEERKRACLETQGTDRKDLRFIKI